jgi:hypothetical protein
MAYAASEEESPVVKSSPGDSIQAWIASFLRYLELRLQLVQRACMSGGEFCLTFCKKSEWEPDRLKSRRESLTGPDAPGMNVKEIRKRQDPAKVRPAKSSELNC